jgi:hypothetical protein
MKFYLPRSSRRNFHEVMGGRHDRSGISDFLTWQSNRPRPVPEQISETVGPEVKARVQISFAS